MATAYANFTDSHVPVPLPHAPALHAVSPTTEVVAKRRVYLTEVGPPDSEAYIAAPASYVVPVRP